MAVKLEVPFVTQLGIGGGANRRNDPTGCWYASVCMVAYYFGAGPRMGLPELFVRDLGGGQLGHLPTVESNHELLVQREDLAAVPNCASGHQFSRSELEQLLRTRGPIFFYWMKRASGSRFGHASVIIGVDDAGILTYHDPENAPNSRMQVARFNAVRQRWQYAMMQRR
jgi:hypothetical protein